MIFFFDRNVGTSFPQVLGRLDMPVSIEYHQQHFAQNSRDDEWLQLAGFYDWFVITQDYSFHKRPRELEAIKQYQVGCFYLWGANQTTWEVMRVFVRAFDRIVRAAQETPRPFIYRIHQNGRLTRVKIDE